MHTVQAEQRNIFMRWVRTYRVVASLNLLIVVAQFVSAGLMLEGNDSAMSIHGFTAALIVLVTLLQTAVSMRLRAKCGAPFGLIGTNLGLLAGEGIEGVCGYFHILAIHVPLAAAILAGVHRQFLWSLRETGVRESQA